MVNICILHIGFQLNLYHIFKIKAHLCELKNMECSSVVSRFVTFCSVCLLADFLLVIYLLLGDYDSADFSNLYICYFVNIQGIARHLRLELMVLINLKHVK